MENEAINNSQQAELMTLLNELLLLQGERNALITDKVTMLSERVGWSELSFKRMEDSGVIHMAGVIRKMVKDLEMLQVKHNKLSMFVKNHLEDSDQGSHGGEDSQSPLSTHLQKSLDKLGR